MQKLARATRLACAAVSLAALAYSPAASAQTATRRTRQRVSPAPAKTPAAAPAPLSPVVAVLPAPVLGPRASDQGTRLAASAGVEAPLDDNASSRFKVQLGIATELRRIGPRARLEGVLSVGYVPYSDEQAIAGVTTSFQSNTFDLVPAFRFAFGLGSKVTVEADTGLGAAYTMIKSTTKSSLGSTTTSEDDWGEVLRFAAGLSFDVNDNLRLGGRIGLDVHFFATTSKAVPVLFDASWRF